jgi:hypothetical protein
MTNGGAKRFGLRQPAAAFGPASLLAAIPFRHRKQRLIPNLGSFVSHPPAAGCLTFKSGSGLPQSKALRAVPRATMGAFF